MIEAKIARELADNIKSKTALKQIETINLTWGKKCE